MKHQEVMKKAVAKAITQATGESYTGSIPFEHPRELKNGDYASNIALRLAGQLKQSPLVIAQKMVDILKEDHELAEVVEKVEAVKPGFLNFYLSSSYLSEIVFDIHSEREKYGKKDLGDKKVLIEYSQMNVAKPMHVGHLRNVFLGDSLKRIHKFFGLNTVSDTHYGDWGTQFGMVLYAYKNSPDKSKMQSEPISELVRMYVEMNKKIKEDPGLRELAKAEFKKLEDGDQENKKLWQWFVKESINVFDFLYERLDILDFEQQYGESGINYQDVKRNEYKDFGESVYEPLMKKILVELLEKEIAVQEDNLIYVDLENVNLGRCILQKSDGATTYHLRDMATYYHRIEVLKMETNLYVIDSRQSHHFNQLFEVIKRLNWKGGDISKHVSYGFIKLKEGSLSTREGRIIQAYDVIEEGTTKARRIVEEKNPVLVEKDKVVKEVSNAAIKFAYLLANKDSDLIFDWDKVLSFEGDTGPYLQYTYARVQSLRRKCPDVKYSAAKLMRDDHLEYNSDELNLLRRLYRFSEEVEIAYQMSDPHFIAEYLLSLAHAFNAFYGSTKIVQAKDRKLREQRLAISLSVAIVLKNGLGLLGINVVEEM